VQNVFCKHHTLSFDEKHKAITLENVKKSTEVCTHARMHAYTSSLNVGWPGIRTSSHKHFEEFGHYWLLCSEGKGFLEINAETLESRHFHTFVYPYQSLA
jgi:hypothetical protein